MAVKFTYEGVQVECDTPEEAAALIRALRATGDGASESEHHAGAERVQRGNALDAARGNASDRALLHALVQASSTGLEAGRVGNMLGTQKRGIEPAIQRWAVRVGLTTEGSTVAVAENTRIGDRRAWRLTAGMLDVGRHILGQT